MTVAAEESEEGNHKLAVESTGAPGLKKTWTTLVALIGYWRDEIESP